MKYKEIAFGDEKSERILERESEPLERREGKISNTLLSFPRYHMAKWCMFKKKRNMQNPICQMNLVLLDRFLYLT